MTEPTGNKPREIKLEIHADDDIARGVYSNFIIGNFTETEMAFDFIFVHPQASKAKVLSRVILSPIHARRLFNMLGRQLQAYEQRFGPVPDRSGVVPTPTTGSDDTLN